MNLNDSITKSETADSSCIILGVFQALVGVLLVIASIYGFSVLQSYVVLIPALMGSALLVNGVRAFAFKCVVYKMLTSER
jgi:hypothetical protein